MKTYGILFSLALMLLTTGCKNEEVLEPSNLDINWYEIKNDPSDPLQSVLYEVYKDYGVSLFTSTILGEVERRNEFGQVYTHQEVLSYGYDLTGSIWNEKNVVTYSEDEASLQACAEALRDLVIPKLKQHGICPRAFMLAAKMKINYDAQVFHGQYTPNSWNFAMEPVAHKATNASLVAAGMLGQMDRTEFALRVLAEEYKAVFRKRYPNEYAAYITLTETRNIPTLPIIFYWVDDPDMYKDTFLETYPYSYGIEFDPYDLADIEDFDTRNYGFLLGMFKFNKSNSLFPCEDADISEFFYHALKYTKAEFDTANASYPVLKNKFAIIKRVVEAIEAE